MSSSTSRETAHPLPWRLGPLPRTVVDATGEPVAVFLDEATARLIVDAVNGRDMVTTCHAALAELDQTRWNVSGGSMREWAETVEGRTFARVQKARELLQGIADEEEEGA